MKIALAGGGAFGEKHLDALKQIDDIEIVSIVGRDLEPTRALAARYGAAHATTDLAETLALPGLDAVILATPTPLHASQAIQCLEAGIKQFDGGNRIDPPAFQLLDLPILHLQRLAAQARHRGAR